MSGSSHRIGLCSAAFLVAAGLSMPVTAQPVPLTSKTRYAVATFTAPDSPNNAGNAATLHMSDWTSKGWVPMGVAAQYSEHELEGTTVKATPLWAVHVLMSCAPSHLNSCQTPTGPAPHP